MAIYHFFVQLVADRANERATISRLSYSLVFFLEGSIQVESGVEVLAHDLSLVPLSGDLVGSERFEHNESNDNVGDSPVHPGGSDTGSDDGGLVAELNVEEVSSGEHTGEEGGGGENALSVVHSIDDSLVLLPLVLIHLVDSCFVNIIIKSDAAVIYYIDQ